MRKAILVLFLLGLLLLGQKLILDAMTESLRQQLSVGGLAWWMWKYYVYAYPILALILAGIVFFSEEIKGHVRLLLGKFYESGTPIRDTKAWEAVCHVLIHSKEIAKWHDETGFETAFYQAVQHLEHLMENTKNPIVSWGLLPGTFQRHQITPQMMFGHNLTISFNGQSVIDRYVPTEGPLGKLNTVAEYENIMFWGKQIDSRFPGRYFVSERSKANRVLIFSLQWIIRNNKIRERYKKGFRGDYCIYQPTESIVWDVCRQFLLEPGVQIDGYGPEEIESWLKSRVEALGKKWGVYNDSILPKILARSQAPAFRE